MKNLSKLQYLTYQVENQKLKQLWIEQRSPLLKGERLLAVYHTEVPWWMSLELQECQNQRLEEEGMELIHRHLLLQKM